MSLDISLVRNQPTTVYSSNITHNLTRMADEAGIYKHLWEPEENSYTLASQLIGPLENALTLLKSDPERFKKYNAPNNWGVYEDFVNFIEKYLDACKQYPNATIEIWK